MVSFLQQQNQLIDFFQKAYSYKKVRPAVEIETKTLETNSDVVVWTVLVTSWGGDAAKNINGVLWERDLGGDYFYPNYTDFGDQHVKRLKGFYEHSINSLVNPNMPEDQQYLGPATLVKVDEWGRWWDFEISRTLPYYEYLESLKSLNLLGASTQAYFGGVTRESDGRLKRWWESEESLTPTPMDPTTLGQVYDAAKAYNVPFANHEYQKALQFFQSMNFDMKRSFYMPKPTNKKDGIDLLEKKDADLEEETVNTAEPVIGSEDTTEEPVADVEEEVEGEEDLAAEIKSLFNDEPEPAPTGTDKTVVPSVSDLGVDIKSLDGMSTDDLLKTLIKSVLQTQADMKALSSFVSGYVDMWGSLDDLPELVSALGSIQQATTKNLKISQVTQNAVKHFAEGVAKTLKSNVQDVVSEELGKSKIEREFEDSLEINNGNSRKNAPVFPAGAPGAN